MCTPVSQLDEQGLRERLGLDEDAARWLWLEVQALSVGAPNGARVSRAAEETSEGSLAAQFSAMERRVAEQNQRVLDEIQVRWLSRQARCCINV